MRKRVVRGLVLFVLASGLYGCQSSGYLVQYDSTPQSAMVVCNGQQKGFTPLNLYYNLDKGQRVLHTQPCEAHWIGGARVSFGQTINLDLYPKGVVATATNPQPTPNDMQFDYQRKQQIAEYNARERYRQSMLLDNYLYQNRIINTFCNTIAGMTSCSSY